MEKYSLSNIFRFNDPAVQAVFDGLIEYPKPTGDYHSGVYAYAFGKARHFTPDFPCVTNDDCKNYYSRVKCWQQGYDEAAQDPRYQELHRLALEIKRLYL